MNHALQAFVSVGTFPADRDTAASAGLTVFLMFAAGMYLMPTAIAAARNVYGMGWLIFRNLALGWLPWVWIACMWRACTWPRRRPVRPAPPPQMQYQQNPYAPPAPAPRVTGYRDLPWDHIADHRNREN